MQNKIRTKDTCGGPIERGRFFGSMEFSETSDSLNLEHPDFELRENIQILVFLTKLGFGRSSSGGSGRAPGSATCQSSTTERESSFLTASEDGATEIVDREHCDIT